MTSMPAAVGHILCKLFVQNLSRPGCCLSPLYFGVQLQGMNVANGQLHVDMSLLKEFLDTKGLWQEFGNFLVSKSAQDSE